jgi:hypothetical protein
VLNASVSGGVAADLATAAGAFSFVAQVKDADILNTLSAKLQKRAERKYRRSGLKVRLFSQFEYKAKTWDKKRRGIAKAE